MKPWRPKRRKQAEEGADAASDPPEPKARGLFLPTGLTRKVKKPAAQSFRTIRIGFVHLAMVPPAVGVGILVLLPFLLSSQAPEPPVGSGRNQVLLGRDGAPVQLTAPDGLGGTRQVSIGEAIYADALPLADRREAARQLGLQRGEDSLSALVRAAEDDDPVARRLACYGLVRRLDDPRAQDALTRLLMGDDAQVARETAAALGTVERGGYLLLDRLREPDDGGSVHAACLRGLNYSGTPDLVPLLMPFVESEGARGQAAAHTVWMICKRTNTPLPPELPRAGRR